MASPVRGTLNVMRNCGVKELTVLKVLASLARGKKAGSGKGEEQRTCICPTCGDTFEGLAGGRFCSGPCRTAWLKDYGRRPEKLAV